MGKGPTCYYGSARPNDIDFPTFIMLFDAIFKQGLSKLEMGIRAFGPDDKRLKELGVERRMNSPIKSIERYQDQITQVITESENHSVQSITSRLWRIGNRKAIKSSDSKMISN